MTTTENQAKFATFVNTKEVIAWLSEFQVQGTKATYASALFRYWNESLSKKYPTRRIGCWREESVKQPFPQKFNDGLGTLCGWSCQPRQAPIHVVCYLGEFDGPGLPKEAEESARSFVVARFRPLFEFDKLHLLAREQPNPRPRLGKHSDLLITDRYIESREYRIAIILPHGT